MPANLRTCADCSTQYAIDVPACPHCGSSNTVEEGGATHRRLPLFVTVRCDCGRGPWTVRLGSVMPGLIQLPTLACASCGRPVSFTWPPEEEPMSPKITVHGGATNARDADVSPAVDASKPLVGAEADQGLPTSEQEVSADEAVGEALPEVSADLYGEDATSLDSDEPPTDPYAGMTLAELRAEADRREIPSYGTKAQITERLKEADAGSEPESEPAGE